MNKPLTVFAVAHGALAAAAVVQQHRIASMASRIEELRWGVLPLDIKRTMAWKQRYFDKAWHAGNAQDWQAAGWYLRQVERMAEGISQAKLDDEVDYGPISTLEQTMFLPQFAGLYRAVDAGDKAMFVQAYRGTVQVCNACHAATRHGYVRIAVPGEGVGGWSQRFEPSAPERQRQSDTAPAFAAASAAALPPMSPPVKP